MNDSSQTTDLRGASEIMRLLEIQFDEITPTRVSGSIAADERHHQPWGLVQGGLYTTAIETFATTGAFEAVKDRGQQAVGVTNTPTSSAHMQAAVCACSRARSTRAAHNSSGRSRSADSRTTS